MSTHPDLARIQSLAEDLLQGASAPLSIAVSHQRQELLRIGNTVVLHAGEIEQTSVTFRAVVDGRAGVIKTTDPSREGLLAARAAAIAQAREGSEPGDLPPLPTPAEAGELVTASPIEAPAPLAPATLAQQLGTAFEQVRAAGCSLAGSLVTGQRSHCVLNSHGLVRGHRGSYAGAKMIAFAEASAQQAAASGYAAALVPTSGALDLVGMARRAAQDARDGRAPRTLEPGRYDVVLEPAATLELLEWLGIIAFGSRSAREGTSFLAGQRGQELTGPAVTLGDPGPLATVLPIPFDGEGVARRPLTFIDAGHGGDIAWDRADAARAGCASTGHGGGEGGVPGSIVWQASPNPSGDLVQRLERGLHITRFHYVNGLLNPKKATMTGLTRDGLFLVEGGERVGGVGHLRWTEDLLDAFRRIDGLGDTLRSAPGFWIGEGGGANMAPQLLIRDWSFTAPAAG